MTLGPWHDGAPAVDLVVAQKLRSRKNWHVLCLSSEEQQQQQATGWSTGERQFSKVMATALKTYHHLLVAVVAVVVELVNPLRVAKESLFAILVTC
jgi:hypothetical protein